MEKFNDLLEEELLDIEGGIEPITIVLGLGTLFLGSVKAGYDFGKDLARRGK